MHESSEVSQSPMESTKIFPHPKILAYFAAAVYSENESSRPSELVFPGTEIEKQEWILDNTVKGTHGYFGVAYYNERSKHTIIAHRGTVLDWWDPWVTFCNLAADRTGPVNGFIPSILKNAYEFTYGIVEKYRANSRSITVTGHSLGAWLAQVVTYMIRYPAFAYDVYQQLGKEFAIEELAQFQCMTTGQIIKPLTDCKCLNAKASYHLHCVGFDSPGCKKLIDYYFLEKYIEKHVNQYGDNRNVRLEFVDSVDITIYLADINMVNTCGEHVGSLIHMKKRHGIYGSIHGEYYTENILKTKESHGMLEIARSWRSVGRHANFEMLSKVLHWKTENRNDGIVNRSQKYVRKTVEGCEVDDVENCYKEGESFRMNVFSNHECFNEKLFVKYLYLIQESKCGFKWKEIFTDPIYSSLREFGDKLDILEIQIYLRDCFQVFSLEKCNNAEQYVNKMLDFVGEVKALFPFNDQPDSNILQLVISRFNNFPKLMEVRYGLFSDDYYETNLNRFKIGGVEYSITLNDGENVKDLYNKYQNPDSGYCKPLVFEVQSSISSFKKICTYILSSEFHYEPGDRLNLKPCVTLNFERIRALLGMNIDFYDEIKKYKDLQFLLIEVTTEDFNLEDLINQLDRVRSRSKCRVAIVCNPRHEISDNIICHKIRLEEKDFVFRPNLTRTENSIWDKNVVLHDRHISLKDFWYEENSSEVLREIVISKNPAIIINNKLKKLSDSVASFQNVQKRIEIIDYLFDRIKENIPKEIFIVTGCKKDEFQKMFLKSKTPLTVEKKEELLEILGNKVRTRESSISDSEFRELCLKEQKAKTVYWINCKNEETTWMWVYSPEFYFERRLKLSLESEFFHENTVVDNITNFRRLVLTDCPGMGKSTTMAKLSELVCIHNWLINISCGDSTEAILHVIKSKNEGENFENRAANFLFEAGNFSDTLDKSVVLAFIKYKIKFFDKTKNPIVVILDGFDEIIVTDEDKKEFLKFLNELSKTEIIIWVTGRSHERQRLSENLQQISLPCIVDFEKLGNDAQKQFLKFFWNLRIQLLKTKETKENIFNSGGIFDEFWEALSSKFNFFNDRSFNEFIGIPLQLIMIGEQFLDDFINNDKSRIENLDLKTLYEGFIKAKYKIYLLEKRNLNSMNASIQMQEIILEDIDNKLQKLALLEVFLVADFKRLVEFNYFGDKDENFHNFIVYDLKLCELLTVGLIQYSHNSAYNYQFLHRSIAEYFCSKYLLNWMRMDSVSQLKFLGNYVLRSKGFILLRKFINVQLETDKKIERHRLYKNWNSLIFEKKIWLMDSIDLSAEENTISITRFLLNILYRTLNNAKKDWHYTLSKVSPKKEFYYDCIAVPPNVNQDAISFAEVHSIPIQTDTDLKDLETALCTSHTRNMKFALEKGYIGILVEYLKVWSELDGEPQHKILNNLLQTFGVETDLDLKEIRKSGNFFISRLRLERNKKITYHNKVETNVKPICKGFEQFATYAFYQCTGLFLSGSDNIDIHDFNLMKLMLKYTDLNTDIKGLTPLMIACFVKPYHDCIGELVARSTEEEINRQDLGGHTFLHYFFHVECIDVSKFQDTCFPKATLTSKEYEDVVNCAINEKKADVLVMCKCRRRAILQLAWAQACVS